jgi:uncharacterized membrane protein
VNTTLSPAAAYVDAVRTALADLPADDLAEIVDDIRDHVEQVATELGEDVTSAALEQRLGTPADYAAELRSAAGYPPGPGAAPVPRRRSRLPRGLTTWSVRIAVVLTAAALLEAFVTGRYGGALFLAFVAWLAAVFAGLVWLVAERSSDTPRASLGDLPDMRRLDKLVRWLRNHPAGAATVETITSLRPAWWIVRAWIGMELIGLFFLAEWFPLPTFPGAPLVLAVAVVISVWLGRRAAAHRHTSIERVLVLLGNIVAVLALAATVGSLARGGVLFVRANSQPEARAYIGEVRPGAYHEDGRPITNLYPYGPDGRLLENVRLYDQDGRPFTSLAYDGCRIDKKTGELYLPALNVFPRPSSSYGGTLRDECQDLGIVPPFGSTLPGIPSGNDVGGTTAPTPSS